MELIVKLDYVRRQLLIIAVIESKNAINFYQISILIKICLLFFYGKN